MTKLLKGGRVVNVFTDCAENVNVLIENGIIIGVGDYDEADEIIDVTGRTICPSFIDGHIHIESTMLRPAQFAAVCIPHGTGAVVADPHEIANVCGVDGITYMMQSSRGLPMNIFFTLPSCVPATGLDESGAVLTAAELEPFYSEKAVIGLAEMMNYPGVIGGDGQVLEKIARAKANGRLINGHAPLLSGKALDKYIAAGIKDDHECTGAQEAKERVSKGQFVMIREGTSARNLESLSELFDEPYNRRCLLVTDDKHPYDLLENGHIDAAIRKAVSLGKNVFACIRMATLQAAEHFGIKDIGAVAPGYIADLLVLDDLESVSVRDVYFNGECVCRNGEVLPFEASVPSKDIESSVFSSFNIKTLTADDFRIEPKSDKCRVIGIVPGEILTDERIFKIDFTKGNGVDTERDIIKLAVCERHKGTGHIGLGFVNGLGIKRGAIASSVSHDSHNLIIAGTNDDDMALAGNTVAQMNGGLCAVLDGRVLARCPLPVAGLMSVKDARGTAEDNLAVRKAAKELGAAEGVEPFMNLAFISLPVIPNIKMTTFGLADVNCQELIPLFVE